MTRKEMRRIVGGQIKSLHSLIEHFEMEVDGQDEDERNDPENPHTLLIVDLTRMADALVPLQTALYAHDAPAPSLSREAHP